MGKLEGLSNDPAVAYEQGRRDGRAETLHAVELAATDNQQTQPTQCTYIPPPKPCSWCDGAHATLNHSFCSNCGRDLLKHG